jgi:cyclic pyranopterin phosphate synthase
MPLEPFVVGEILSYEEILRVIRIVASQGVNKIRITGGEPLVRKGLVDFIRRIRQLEAVQELSLTTNGSLLSGMAQELKTAGLDRVNISIDTMDPVLFTQITGNGNLTDTLAGMEAASKVGFTPVKLNVVVTSYLSNNDIQYFISQTIHRPMAVRFIEYMPMGWGTVKPGMSMDELKKVIAELGYGALEPAVEVGNGPAVSFRLPQAVGTIGFITPISAAFCSSCNRIRLSADGKIKPCLLANYEVDIKSLLRQGSSDEEIYQAIVAVAAEKAPGHQLCHKGQTTKLIRGMSQIGG